MLEPLGIVVVVLWVAVIAAGVTALRTSRKIRRARERLVAEGAAPAEPTPALGPFVVRRRWVALVAAVLVGGVATILGIRPVFAAAFALMGAVVAFVADGMRVEARFGAIEGQLGDAIDLVIGGLRAGAGLLESLELATREIEPPLKTQLGEVTAKIRYGEAPQKVFSELTERVPLDTVRLFALTLSVNWEVGGSIVSGLTTVGRTIRDKIELGRRIRSRTTQARMSVLGILGISYFIAVLMWRADPHRMEEFLGTNFGADAAGFAMVLQALGLVWMSALVRIEQ